VQAIRAAAALVSRELQNEPMPSLSEEQRAMIENELNRTPVRRRRVLGYLSAATLGAAAAIAVNFALASALHKDVVSPRDTRPVAIAPQLNEHASGDDA